MTKINPHIFRAYDIRGIAHTSEMLQPTNDGKTTQPPNSTSPAQQPADLTPKTMEMIGRATAFYLKKTDNARNMIVGRDNRLHSEVLQKAFIKGVLSTGINVTDMGLATSPLLYYSVCKFNFDSGVNITASHNPKEYNGVKIVRKNAHSVCGDELQEILKIIESDDFNQNPNSNTQTSDSNTQTTDATPQTSDVLGHRMSHPTGQLTTKTDCFSTYLEDIKSRIQLSRPLKVVVDAGNGTAGKFAPELLRAIGAEVIELYCELDGNFPNHEANPEEEENMRDLAALVIKEKADIGIGFDGDGDRVGVIDENGKHYSADFLLILLARDLLKSHPKSQIVFDVKVSTILINEITKLGGVPVMSKTGHSFIETKMHELGAPLAGEISGHLFFGKTHYNYFGFDDALLGAAKILQILSNSDKTFSEQFTDLPKMATTPEFKAHCPDDKKFEIVKKLQSHFTRAHKCVTIDGVRVNFDDTSWGAVRCSNTSPNLTLRFEAQNEERLKEIQKIMVAELKNHPDVSLAWYKE